VAPRPPAAGLSAALAREVEALPREQVLAEQGAYVVLQGTAAQLPHLVEELGRLREISFRAVGEGTGRATDLDAFDAYYRHLVLWNREREEVAGAYRFGLMDEIVRERGAAGLYLSTLFRVQPALLRAINPCLELGRSFVRPEYQRGYLPLMLLWKGIAQFIVAHPQYRHLIGPVSINAQYSPLSRRLLVDYLLRHHRHETLAPLVQAWRPPRLAGPFGFAGAAPLPLPRELEQVAALVEALEPEQAGVPVLLKSYLRLGGRVLGFNVDPQFSHVLDALLLVDVTRMAPRTQERFMGRAEAEGFMDWHRARGAVGVETPAEAGASPAA
jgi:putative hemolysin